MCSIRKIVPTPPDTANSHPAETCREDLTTRGDFARAEFSPPGDPEPVCSPVVPHRDAGHEIAKDRTVLEEMAGTAASEEHVLEFGLLIHDEMRVGRQDHLVELRIHHPFADEARQAVADLLAGLGQRCFLDQALVVVVRAPFLFSMVFWTTLQPEYWII